MDGTDGGETGISLYLILLSAALMEDAKIIIIIKAVMCIIPIFLIFRPYLNKGSPTCSILANCSG